MRAETVVDLAAIRRNVRALRAHVGPDVAMMTVVKADGYGHGLAEAACTAREAGADWLGVATPLEAQWLRTWGDTGPVLCWLTVPEDHLEELVEADVDITAYGISELDAISAAVRRVARPARVQLKVDTGLSRGGADPSAWPNVVARARAGEVAGDWEVTGIWSHLSSADEPDDPANAAQEKLFREALDVATDGGLRPRWRHLANSAAALTRPSSHFDLVRCGIASYGLDPVPGRHEVELVPAMTARAALALVKPVDAGAAVSYGRTWIADAATTLGLVPVGYADGVLRQAGNRAQAFVAGSRAPVRGVVCMDQFVVDLGPSTSAQVGDTVVLFGPGTRGEPTAADWAEAAGTIHYEIVTRLGGRFWRRHIDTDLYSELDHQRSTS